MAEPVRRDIVARRDCPYFETWSFTDEAGDPYDFTGATLTLEVRLYGAQAGDALVSLVETGSTQTQGLYVGSGEITPWIDEATLRLIPDGRVGQDVVFQYDLKVQPAGEVEQIWSYGEFRLKPWITDRLSFLMAGPDHLVAGGSYLITR